MRIAKLTCLVAMLLVTSCGGKDTEAKKKPSDKRMPTEAQLSLANIAARDAQTLADAVTACLKSKPAAECSQEKLAVRDSKLAEQFAKQFAKHVNEGSATISVEADKSFAVVVSPDEQLIPESGAAVPGYFQYQITVNSDGARYTCAPAVKKLCVYADKEQALGSWPGAIAKGEKFGMMPS